jgi:hypothetical protein
MNPKEMEDGLYQLLIDTLTQSSPEPVEDSIKWESFQEAYQKIKRRWPSLRCSLFDLVQYSRNSASTSIQNRLRFNLIDDEMQINPDVASYVMNVARQVAPGNRLAYGREMEYFEDHPLYVIYEKMGPQVIQYLFIQTTQLREGNISAEFRYFPFPPAGVEVIEVTPFAGRVFILSECRVIVSFDRETLDELLKQDVKVFKAPSFVHSTEYFAMRFEERGIIKVVVSNTREFFDDTLENVFNLVEPLHQRKKHSQVRKKIIPKFIEEPTSHFSEAKPWLVELNDCITKTSRVKEEGIPAAEIYVYKLLLLQETSSIVSQSNFFRHGLLKLLSKEEVYYDFFKYYAGREIGKARYKFYLFVSSLLRMDVRAGLINFLVKLLNYVLSEEIWLKLYKGYTYET